ncbi:MAG: hypothetical protein LBH68_01470, partial [Bifidobacteriaceae bacterium]|nr:hypothetical protein [Bifidobacteriaceae bacterium]
ALPQGEVLFMVCSDGLFGAVDHAELRATLLADASTAEICDNLALAAWRGTARDNFSVLVARVGAVGAAAPSERPGITLDQT